MATRKRRYDPNVPIEISSEVEEENGDSSVIKKDGTKKVQVKVVKRTDSNIEEEEGVSLNIEIDIPLRWVMICYCQRLGLDFQTTRFEFNAAKLRDLDTPHQLGMVQNDVIFAFPNHGGLGYGAVHYVTLCIRMHKGRDMFHRVKRSTALLPQLMRCFSNSDPRELRSLCLVYGGLKLTQNHTASELKMEDGDIIDGFYFSLMKVQRMKKTEYPIAKANEENKKIVVTVKWINNNIDDIKDDDNDELDDKKEIINFRIENDVPLRWLMILYCDKIGLNFDTTRFEFNGARLRGFDTPLHVRMLSFDVIYAYSSPCSNGLVHSNCRVHNNGDGRSSGLYQVTICIRMHKQKDTFVRVIRATPLLPQLTLGLSNAGIVVEGGPMCFVREGTRLTREHTAKELDIVNGDVVDAFIFDKHSCSLSIIEASKHSQESEQLYLEVSVASKYHEPIYFRLKRNTRLKKLMDVYCHRFKMLKGALFFYHGRALDGSKSPDEEKLVDKAIIYAFPINVNVK
ncbi:uncharacterized protein LOC110732604 [Chenopodium quinoa]|uniref:uncharacterized protein LOC110732604 n=1 Tax=Chenopodium quinoa TaxID=63459 RepID=UPI000B780175|nr:uncharacterized protein LOC110732604 [Chenopodium quinoa]